MAPDKKRVTVDVDEFVRTRDALSTAFMSLSSSVDKAVKAYIEHTNAVLAGDASLNISYLTQPFNALNAAAGVAQQTSKALKGSAAAGEPSAAAEEDPKSKKRKRAYKARDPNAPKRPLTAYFRYLGEMRPILTIELAKDPGVHKPGQLSQVATERWNKLSEAERKPYHDAYQTAKAVYEQDVEDYKARNGQLVAEDEEEEEEQVAPVSKPVIVAAAEQEDDDDDDDEDDDDDDDEDDDDSSDESLPPPPKVKKSASPETVKKTPKAPGVDKTPKTITKTDKPTSTPMFNSINPAPVSTGKKRKSEAADAATPKKKRGRPSKADKLAAEAAAAAVNDDDDDDDSTEEEQPKKKEKPKKKKTVEA